ncbi:MAG: 50S ribosomal protein L11 methyltransferase [Bacillota bacterium]
MSGPAWKRITIETTPEGVELMANLLLDHGAGGVVVEAAAVSAYFHSGTSCAGCLDAITRAVAALPSWLDLGSRRITAQAVDDADWTEAWRKHFRPFRVGSRLVVVPSWDEFSGGPRDLVVRLDPARAFGSGEHPTTAMALAMLEKVVMPGAVVVDVGTGSGILAIAAARLGASRVYAVDIDEAAVASAVENVRTNRVEQVVTVTLGTLGDLEVAGVDVIVANIVANVLVSLAPEVSARLVPAGRLIAGGIIDRREADVILALEEAGLVILEKERQQDWISLLAAPACPGVGRDFHDRAHLPKPGGLYSTGG